MSFIQNLASGGFDITPSANDLPQTANGIRVGGSGSLVIETIDGSSLTLNSVVTGETVPFKVRKVLAATTATNLIGYKSQ